MDKKVWIIIAVVLVFFGGLVWWNSTKVNPNIVPTAVTEQFDLGAVITKDNLPEGFSFDSSTPATNANNVIDYYYGDKDAKVVFIEYGDLSCSHCAQFDPIIERAREAYSATGQVAFVFRYFYLGNQGVNGLAAATAVDAAARQGKFWEMKALVYEKQSDWFYASANERKGILQVYAEQMSIDMDQWSKDYDNYQTNGIKTRVDFGHALGERVEHFCGTPTIVISGHTLNPGGPDCESGTADDVTEDAWSTQEKLFAQIDKYVRAAYGDNAIVPQISTD